MEANRPLLRIGLGVLRRTHRLPPRNLQPFSQQCYQLEGFAKSVDKTAAAMSSANASTVMDAVKHDHAELKEYYENILGAKDDDSKIRWQNQFTWELARHSIGEELVVYPAMEKHMGDVGKQMADRDRAEHTKVGRGPIIVESLLCDFRFIASKQISD